MDFAFDDETDALLEKVGAFMDAEVTPNEGRLREEIDQLAADDAWTFPAVVGEVRAKAKEQGLWNFFLPGYEGPHGRGLSNLQYAPIAELTGRSIQLAPSAFNCAAPDTGNMEVLHLFGTPEQKEQWLEPLLEGTIRSSFAMTEPQVASSDATNIELSIVRDGGDYVINGRKWWITGAMNPESAIFIVMGKTDPEAERHRQQSMILVPRDTPGLEIKRGMRVFGYADRDHGGHAELAFHDVRVPASNIIGGEGEGFAIAQARLGPGRIHHCMRSIGLAERALTLLCKRISGRSTFGRKISEQTVWLERIANARMQIDQSRLLVLQAAHLMDTVGNKAAAKHIAMIKVATPAMACQVLDWAIQAHGGGGVCDDFPLAAGYAHARTLRLVDGPDEVHRNQIARLELAQQLATA